MFIFFRYILLLIFVASVYPDDVPNEAMDYKCCVPDQWESQLYAEYNEIAYLLHINVTASVAYDYTNSVLFVNATEFTYIPIADPKQQTSTSLYIADYKHGMEYEVDDGKRCQKSRMSGDVMIKQCIKGNDKLLYSGRIGNGIMTDTYNTSISKDFNNVRATIQRDRCLPIHLAYIVNNDYGSLLDVDVLNLTPGITDRKIFEEPVQCKNVTVRQRNSKKEDYPFIPDARKFFIKRMLFGGVKAKYNY